MRWPSEIRAKRHRAVRVGEDYEPQQQCEKLFSEIEAFSCDDWPDRFRKRDAYAKVWQPTPTDKAEQKGLASTCRICGEAGHHRRQCPNMECFGCEQRCERLRSPTVTRPCGWSMQGRRQHESSGVGRLGRARAVRVMSIRLRKAGSSALLGSWLPRLCFGLQELVALPDELRHVSLRSDAINEPSDRSHR